jgi:hypothetical protein
LVPFPAVIPNEGGHGIHGTRTPHFIVWLRALAAHDDGHRHIGSLSSLLCQPEARSVGVGAQLDALEAMAYSIRTNNETGTRKSYFSLWTHDRIDPYLRVRLIAIVYLSIAQVNPVFEPNLKPQVPQAHPSHVFDYLCVSARPTRLVITSVSSQQPCPKTRIRRP